MSSARGLEAHHGPLTEVFPRAASAARRARWRLTDEQVGSYNEHGFLLDLPLLDHAQVLELRDRLERIGESLHELEGLLHEIEQAWRERPHEVVLHLLGAWRVDEWFHDLVFHPGVGVPLAQLLETDRLRFWHDQVFWKPAQHPGVVPWHQDYSYWTRTAPAQHITMFIALDDMDLESGCLQYVPGSQQWGLLPSVSFGGPLEQLREHLSPEQRRAFEPCPVRLTAGRAAIHHSHTVHGSLANTSARPRRAIVLNFMGPDVRVADGSRPLLKGVPRLEPGAPLGGEFFPLI